MARRNLFPAERARLAEAGSSGSLVLFVGAGASADAGLPVWKTLIDPLRRDLGVGAEGDDLDVAQWYADACGRGSLLRHVRRTLAAPGTAGRGLPRPGPLDRALARIPAPVWFTTNFDRLLETAIEEAQHVPPDVIIEDPDVGLIDEARRTTVVKLHGCLSLPDTIVLARDDYETYEQRHPAMVAYLQSLLATRTFLFVGYSLTDQDFRSIYHAIARALGERRHRAYVLEVSGRSEHVAKYWRSKGILTLAFQANDFTGVREFVERLADEADVGHSVDAAARVLGGEQPPPPLSVQPLLGQLEVVGTALEELIHQAQATRIMPGEDAPPADVPDATPWLQKKARALLDLAEAVDRLAPIADPAQWAALGDMLYSQHDYLGSIRAYNNALRPTVGRRELGERVTLHVRGNLGRAYAYEGHHGRAEWLLRRCVFEPGREVGEYPPQRQAVYDRLRHDHLERRPSDAYEVVYSMTRRIERLRERGHFGEAFEAQCEARYILEPLLGVKNPRLPAQAVWDRFEPYDQRIRLEERERGNRFVAKAWALSFLGKAYRLGCQLGLDLGRRDALSYYLRRAEWYLRYATNLDPLLPFPYAHRLHLAADPRVPPSERDFLVASVRKDLPRLRSSDDGEALYRSLQHQFPGLL